MLTIDTDLRLATRQMEPHSISSDALYDALQYVLAEAEKIKYVARWEDDVQVDCFHAKSGANC